MTTLTCSCGSRLNVKGMPPGKSGVCPSCGGPVRVPGPPASARVVVEDEWNWEGTYGLETAPVEVAAPVEERDWGWEGAYDLTEAPARPALQPPADLESSPGLTRAGAAPVKPREVPPPEPWFPPRLLFPARGLEGVIMVGSLGVAFWVMGTVVPEYSLALVADAAKSAASTMGHLIALVTSLPFLLLGPVVVAYWFQYLARVLISGAEGERNPPRPPDRDADGLLNGLASWAAWGVLGLGGGLVPVAVGYAAGLRDPVSLGALALLGLPYALMALLLTFLHDEDLAARPWKVCGALARVGPSFIVVTLVVGGLLGSVGVAGWLAFRLRETHYPAYFAAGLGSWLLLVWMTLVAMQTLGAYYYARKGRLRWRRPEAWWNVR